MTLAPPLAPPVAPAPVARPAHAPPAGIVIDGVLITTEEIRHRLQLCHKALPSVSIDRVHAALVANHFHTKETISALVDELTVIASQHHKSRMLVSHFNQSLADGGFVSRETEDSRVGVSRETEDKRVGVSRETEDRKVGVSRETEDRKVGVSREMEDDRVAGSLAADETITVPVGSSLTGMTVTIVIVAVPVISGNTSVA